MEQLLVQEGLRADAYKVLAECYYPPDEVVLRTLGGLGGGGETVLAPIVAQAAAVEDIEELAIDHARLFVGPFGLVAPPYGSVYLEDDALMGDSTVDVADWYRQEDMEPAGKDVPDHITAELEFMYVLICREMEAISADDTEAAGLYRQQQKGFLLAHLGAWVARFAERVRQGARTEFYKALARVTDQFVGEDLERLSA